MAIARVPLRARDGATRAHAFVNRGDLPLVNAYSWHLSHDGYAIASARRDGRVTTIRMSRLILGLEVGDGHEVDHKNRNRLDNRRANLRIATRAQNVQNRSAVRGASSAHRNVSYDRRTGLWMVEVTTNGERHYLGRYGTEDAAAQVAARFRAEHLPFSEDALQAVA